MKLVSFVVKVGQSDVLLPLDNNSSRLRFGARDDARVLNETLIKESKAKGLPFSLPLFR